MTDEPDWIDADRRDYLDSLSRDPNADALAPPEELEPDGAPPGRLPDTFWFSRDTLGRIHAAALSWPVAPDGLLGAVLARIAVAHPPSIQLAPRGSLNVLVVLVAPSGGGKSETLAAAEAMLPLDHRTDLVVDVPMGSGEGIADAYLGAPYKVDDGSGNKVWRREQAHAGALFIVDEGQVVAQMGARNGATLLPVLRTAWSGGTLGQKNAAADRDRRLPANRYRFSAVLGIQPHHAAGLLDDAAGGTPQRFLWFPTIDPRIADLDRLPDWPGELHLPTPSTSGADWITPHPDVAAELQRNRIAAAAGTRQIDPLDSHRDLLRLKVAGLLALLEQRRDINPEDWHLAGQVLRSSTHTRAELVALQQIEARRAHDRRIQSKVAEHTATATSAERRALEGGARAIGRKIHRAKPEELPLTRRALAHATASAHKALATPEEMIAHAIAEKWIAEETETDGTALYYPGNNRPA